MTRPHRPVTEPRRAHRLRQSETRSGNDDSAPGPATRCNSQHGQRLTRTGSGGLGDRARALGHPGAATTRGEFNRPALGPTPHGRKRAGRSLEDRPGRQLDRKSVV